MNRLKLMIYNVHSCIDMQKRNSLPRVIELLQREKPEIAGFNEIETFTLRTRFANQPKRLASARDMMYYYGPTIRLGPIGFFGNAVLSRYPIYKTINIPLPGKGEKRFCLKSLIRIPQGLFTVMVTHLGLSSEARELQIACLKDLIRQEKNPVVLMGDFNCRMEQLEPLYELLNDTGLPLDKPTYPFSGPKNRIDYILISPELQCLENRVPYSDASDHLPVIAEINL